MQTKLQVLCKYSVQQAVFGVLLENGLHQLGHLLYETSSVLSGLLMLGCLKLPLGHSSDLCLVKAL